MSVADIKTDCDPIYQVSNLWENQKYSFGYLNKTLTDYSKKTPAERPSVSPDMADTDAATPCGLIAKSLFNDTF